MDEEKSLEQLLGAFVGLGPGFGCTCLPKSSRANPEEGVSSPRSCSPPQPWKNSQQEKSLFQHPPNGPREVGEVGGWGGRKLCAQADKCLARIFRVLEGREESASGSVLCHTCSTRAPLINLLSSLVPLHDHCFLGTCCTKD